MKRLTIYIISIVTTVAVVLNSCDESSIVKDKAPPLDNQIATPGSAEKSVSDSSRYIPDQYIVVFENQANGLISVNAAEQARQLTNTIITELNINKQAVKSRYKYALKGFTAKLNDIQLAALKNDPRIDHITQDHTFDFAPSNTGGSSSAKIKSMVSGSQTTPWGVSRVGGINDGSGQTAWIIDTGIDLDHPDLNVDVINSASFVAGESADDIVGHGTYVAGILAAKNNSQDIVGVAAGAQVVAVKVLHEDPFDNTYSEVIDGIDYVAGKASPGDIVNMSLGDPTPDNSDIDDAVITAANNGIRFVIAAGNDKQNASNATPARVENSNVWTVSAFKEGDDFAVNFDCGTGCFKSSNFGNPPIEFSGPGEDVPSLFIGGGWGMGYSGDGSEDGTSYAAPHIAGLLLALGQEPNHNGFVSNDPDNTADEIVSSRPLAPSMTGTIQNNSPRLDWPAVTDAQSYDIHRKFEAGSWSVIGSTTNSYYVDTDIYSFDLEKVNQPPYDFSDTYAYRVRAVPAAGKDGPWSNLTYYVLDCTGMTCTQSVDK